MTEPSENRTDETTTYRDPAASPQDRADDLLARLTLEDKAGLLFQAMVFVEPECIPAEDGAPLLPGVMHDFVVKYQMNHMNLVNVLTRLPRRAGRMRSTCSQRGPIGHPGHGVE